MRFPTLFGGQRKEWDSGLQVFIKAFLWNCCGVDFSVKRFFIQWKNSLSWKKRQNVDTVAPGCLGATLKNLGTIRRTLGPVHKSA
jgi:hypothetical protein